jgi:replicative DNA helicase
MNDLQIAFKKGLEGKNQGLPTGIPKLDKIIYGVQRGIIIGVAGSPKSGKSSMLDSAFVIHPYLYSLSKPDLKLKIFYWSLEMDKTSVRFKYIAFFFEYDYQISIINLPDNRKLKGLPFFQLSSAYLLGKMVCDNDERIIVSEQHQVIVNEIIENRIIPMFGKYDDKGNKLSEGIIDIIEDKNNSNPTGIRNILYDYAKTNGKLVYEQYKIHSTGEVKQRISGYVPNNPDEHIIVITDHMRALKRERGFTMKQNMDKLTEYQIGMRNLFNYAFIDIIHLNRSISDIGRIKFNNEFLFPNDDDLKDSGNLAEDADALITIFDANDPRYNIKKHFGLDITNIPNYRSLHLVRSRHSEAPAHIQTKMHAGILKFEQI